MNIQLYLNFQNVNQLIQQQKTLGLGGEIQMLIISGINALAKSENPLQTQQLIKYIQTLLSKINQNIQLTKKTVLLIKLLPSIFLSKQIQQKLVSQQYNISQLKKTLKKYQNLSSEKFDKPNYKKKQLKRKMVTLKQDLKQKNIQLQQFKEKLELQSALNLEILNQAQQIKQKLKLLEESNNILNQKNMNSQFYFNQTLEQYRNAFHQQNQKISFMQNLNKQLNSKIQSGFNQFQQIKIKWNQENQTLSYQYQLALKQTEQIKNDIKNYQSLLQLSNNNIQSLNQYINSIQKQISNVINQSNQYVMEKNLQIQILKNQAYQYKSQKEQQLYQSNLRITEKDQTIQSLSKQADQNKRLKQNQLQQYLQIERKLKIQIDLLRIASQKYEITIQQLENNLNNLKMQKDVRLNEKQKLQTLIKLNKKLIDQKQAQNKSLKKQIQLLKKQVKVSQNQISAFKQSFQVFKKQLGSISNQGNQSQIIQTFKGVIAVLRQNKAKIKKTKTQTQNLNAKLQEQQKTIANLILQNNQLLKVVQDRDNSIQKLKIQNKKLKQQIQQQFLNKTAQDQINNALILQNLHKIEKSQKKNELLQENIKKLQHKLKFEKDNFQQISKVFLQKQIQNNQLLVQNLQLNQLKEQLQRSLTKSKLQIQSQRNKNMRLLKKNQFFEQKIKILNQQKQKTNKNMKGIENYLRMNNNKLQNLQSFKTFIQIQVNQNEINLQEIQKKVQKLRQSEELRQIMQNPQKKFKYIMNTIYKSSD